MDNEAILREFMDRVWNKQEKGSVGIFVDPEYKIHLDNGDPWEGRTLNNEEYSTRLNNSFGPFPDIHFDIRSAVADGECVAITWIMTGTNLGNIADFPPTGRSIKTEGMTIYYFRNGKVCGHSQVFDRTTVMKQLGF